MPQDYTVDYEPGIKDPVGMTGVRLEADFHVITAQTNAINNINKCVKRSELAIDNLILEPLASSLSVLSDEEKEAGVCLVDIGGGTTDVAIFHENIIRHTAVIPFGGNIITSDIKQGCMVMNYQAESLKTKFGKAITEEASPNEIVSIPGLRNRPPKEISVKNLSSIIEARMEEIIELVHAEIITSGYEGKLAGGLVLTGGGAQLNSIQQLVEYMTGMDVRIGYPNEHLGKSSSELKSPMYATAIGLVLSGFMSLDDRQNRYNEAKPEERGRKMEFGNLFGKIMEKTKSLLVDDIEGKDNY
jgi:cell division protein FtsA